MVSEKEIQEWIEKNTIKDCPLGKISKEMCQHLRSRRSIKQVHAISNPDTCFVKPLRCEECTVWYKYFPEEAKKYMRNKRKEKKQKAQKKVPVLSLDEVKKLARKITRFRKKHKLFKKEVAKLLGVSENCINSWEKGNMPVTKAPDIQKCIETISKLREISREEIEKIKSQRKPGALRKKVKIPK